MTKKKDIHVVARDNGWAAIKEGGKRASHTGDTQKEVLEKARPQAKREKVELVTHGRDNKIRDSDSYGPDPDPPRDKKH